MPVVATYDNLIELANEIEKSKAIAIDTETNVTESLANRRLVGISFCTDKQTHYIPVGHIPTLFPVENYTHHEDFYIIKETLDKTEGVNVFHNAKFDLQMLEPYFQPPIDRLYDTMLMSHFIDEYPPHGLDELSKIHLNDEGGKHLADKVKSVGKQLGNEGVPVELMAPYAEKDAWLTHRLYTKLKPLFSDYESIWPRDRKFLLVLKEMERTGLLINREQATILSNRTSRRMLEIQDQLGFDPAKTRILQTRLFEMPPVGLGLHPLALTPKGKPSTESDVLSQYGHPVTALVIEFRECQKMVTSYYNSYLELSSLSPEGRLHPTFKQHGTKTGRLSCENPNLQQIPRGESDVKKLFLPDPKCELWEFDFKTLEYRLAAYYARSIPLVNAFRQDADVHQQVADTLGIERHLAKIVNFLIIYGGGADALSVQAKVPIAKARTIISNLKSAYPEIFQVMDQAQEVAEERGYIKYWSGRRRHFKYYEERKAFNSLCQGGGFEIVKDAMINLYDAGYDLRNQVHDSCWVNIPKKDVPDALVEIPKLMTDWTIETFGFRFSVEAKKLN